jgi:signal transduction histidine kinase
MPKQPSMKPREEVHEVMQPRETGAGAPHDEPVNGSSAARTHRVDQSLTLGGARTRFRGDVPSGGISRHLRRAAFRIVQQSLANACRHSKEKRLFAELAVDGNVLRIQIRDWGDGFLPDGTLASSTGVDQMQHRVKLLDGTATIRRESGKGTCVLVEVPLSRDGKSRKAARGRRSR